MGIKILSLTSILLIFVIGFALSQSVYSEEPVELILEQTLQLIPETTPEPEPEPVMEQLKCGRGTDLLMEYVCQ